MACKTEKPVCNRGYEKSNDIFKIFDGAITHSRNKNELKKLLKKSFSIYHIEKYKNQIFCQIYKKVSGICMEYKGQRIVGDLGIYDITAAICRRYDILIDKIYLAGDNGPRKAIEILELQEKIKKDEATGLNYVEIKDAKKTLKDKKGLLPSDIGIQNEKDGDEWESMLCEWQKHNK